MDERFIQHGFDKTLSHFIEECGECLATVGRWFARAASVPYISAMPKGPQGQKRPADAIGLAVMVGKIATGEIEDDTQTGKLPNAAAELGSRGGKARAAKMSPERRAEIARQAAAKRWGKPPQE
jgi:hypothetical protein